MIKYTFKRVLGGAPAERIAHQAMNQYGPALHAAFLDWLQAHPDPLDPIAIIAAGEGQRGLYPIGSRADFMAYAREYRRTVDDAPPFETCVEAIERTPPVPRGSIDVIISTPEMVAVIQATPLPQGVS